MTDLLPHEAAAVASCPFAWSRYVNPVIEHMAGQAMLKLARAEKHMPTRYSPVNRNGGSGRMPITDEQIVAALRSLGESQAPAVAAHLGCAASSMACRLASMELDGLVVLRRHHRNLFWRAAE